MFTLDSSRVTFDNTRRWRLTGRLLRSAWMVFSDNSGIIGYRRIRAAHPVEAAVDGPYRVGDTRYRPKPVGATLLYVEAMTQFGERDVRRATRIAVLLHGAPLEPMPLGSQWVAAGQMVHGSPIIAPQQADIPLDATVREQVCAILRF